MHANRREFLRLGGATAIATAAGCAGGGGQGTPTPRVETVVEERTVVRERTVIKERTASPGELTEIHTVHLEGSSPLIVFLYGLQNNTWRRHGIDLSFEIGAFGKYARAVSSGISAISANSVPPAIQQMNAGEDLTIFGQQLNFFNQMLTLADRDDIQGPTDLGDKTLGVPFSGSTTTNTYRGLMLNEFDFDILNDTAETRSSSPPVLWNLLLDGELDAVIEFSGFTIKANATDDVKTIWDPYERWLDKYGHPPTVSAWTADRGWLQENADVALNYLRGWEDAVDVTLNNINDAVQNYGRVGGLTSEADAEVAKQWMQEGIVIGPFDFPQELADNNWELIELMLTAGAFDGLPDKGDALTTRDELRGWAGQ